MAINCPSCGTRNLEGADQCANCGVDLGPISRSKGPMKVEQTLMELPLTGLDMSNVHAIPPDATLEDAGSHAEPGQAGHPGSGGE